ncbi:MAG: hypothetical protein Q7K45_02010 [Nanoarchaeota archaeon]|nr:hypothetical protein [Nanoarchaeota archaeon]
MTPPAMQQLPHSELILDHLLFQTEDSKWYSGMITQRYLFPAVEIHSTDKRWEGEKIIYLHRNQFAFVPRSWLQGELTVYGIHRELTEQTMLPVEEKVKLLCEREVLQQNYIPHPY